MPTATEAERAVLGAILADPDCAGRAFELLRPEHFAGAREQWIFGAMLSLFEHDKPCDLASVAAALQKQGAYHQAGGADHLLALQGSENSSAHLEHHAELVREVALRRRMVDELETFTSDLRDTAQPVIEVSDRALDRIEALLEPARAVPKWTPYPVEVLPASLRALAVEGSESIGVDPSMIALPALASCAAAAGHARSVRVRENWTEALVLWTATIAPPSARKTPARNIALAPIEAADADAWRAHRLAMKDHDRERLAYNRNLADWQHAKSGEPPPDEPEALRCARLVADDVTLEALADMLDVRPSVLVAPDELGAWFGTWDKYRNGRGADEARWLSLYGGCALRVNRRSRELYIPRALVSVCGTVQPGKLRRIIGPELIESGCSARILWAFPPRPPGGWRDNHLGPDTRDRWAAVVRELVELRPVEHLRHDGDLELRPLELRLSPEALALFIAWTEEVRTEQRHTIAAEAEDAAAGKLEGGAARLAGVIALVRAAEQGRAYLLEVIEAEDMAAGIALARWHLAEARRVYALLRGERSVRVGRVTGLGRPRGLEGWIAKRGGAVKLRDIANLGPMHCRAPGAAEREVEALVRRRRAEVREVQSSPRGGRPSRWVHLLDGATPRHCDNTPAGEPQSAVSSQCRNVADLNPSEGDPEDQDAEDLADALEERASIQAADAPRPEPLAHGELGADGLLEALAAGRAAPADGPPEPEGWPWADAPEPLERQAEPEPGPEELAFLLHGAT